MANLFYFLRTIYHFLITTTDLVTSFLHLEFIYILVNFNQNLLIKKEIFIYRL